MKKLKSISILFMLFIGALAFVECDNNEEQITDSNNLSISKEEQINILKESLVLFKNQSVNRKKSSNYIDNLNYLNNLNNKLDLNLSFTEEEISLIEAIK